MGLSAIRVSVPEAVLDREQLPGPAMLDGSPATSDLVVSGSSDGRVVRGIWEAGVGQFASVLEGNETFVVVSGRATIEPEWGDPIEVGPGDLCVFEAGLRCVWTVHETLRKAYHVEYPR
jgi:uncharacterized protein